MNPCFANTFLHRVFYKAGFVLVMLFCALAGACNALTPRASQASAPSAEWPRTWDGSPLRPLALSAVEQRFAERFPGAIARLTNDKQVVIWRQVNQPTRMLHPAADCYRSLGYQIAAERLERDSDQRLWRCFTAQRAGSSQRVCERIEDGEGIAFTDSSSWYWAAITGQTRGPWQAITVARAL